MMMKDEGGMIDFASAKILDSFTYMTQLSQNATAQNSQNWSEFGIKDNEILHKSRPMLRRFDKFYTSRKLTEFTSAVIFDSFTYVSCNWTNAQTEPKLGCFMSEKTLNLSLERFDYRYILDTLWISKKVYSIRCLKTPPMYLLRGSNTQTTQF